MQRVAPELTGRGKLKKRIHFFYESPRIYLHQKSILTLTLFHNHPNRLRLQSSKLLSIFPQLCRFVKEIRAHFRGQFIKIPSAILRLPSSNMPIHLLSTCKHRSYGEIKQLCGNISPSLNGLTTSINREALFCWLAGF
jgi:hypothetical protein